MFSVQRLALAVGLAGLVPFIAGALGVWLMPDYRLVIENLFYLYSAGILAFMAGVYWPISLQLEERTYPLSPPTALGLSQGFFLVAGIALLLPELWRSLIYPVAYVALYLVDAHLLACYWPSWYRRLRAVLTVVSVLCQVAVAALALV